MPVELRAAAFVAEDPTAAAAFWASMLDRRVVPDGHGVLVPGDATQLGLRFVAPGGQRTGPGRVHLHLTSTSLDDQQATVAGALALGARHLDVGQRPEEGHVVLADPAGHPFCVIEPGNAFLAGCGLLGELACEGTREVGVFWSAALGWPLVWDQDGETAVQSRRGGTKVAWGGPPVAPVDDGEPHRFELAVADDDPAAEIDRLVALGATRRAGGDGVVVLADPDGRAFHVQVG